LQNKQVYLMMTFININVHSAAVKATMCSLGTNCDLTMKQSIHSAVSKENHIKRTVKSS
jgi:hypothetical protein